MSSSPGELDRRYVWHPFTQMAEWEQNDPLVVERGEGAYLVDTQGNRYLDGTSSLWVNLHGHRHPRIDQAITEQLERIAHTTLLGMASGPAAELAERLVRLAPEGLCKVFYSDDGSTAVEVALKMAFQFYQHEGQTHKTRFVHLTDAYHGDTLGAVSVGGIAAYHRVFGPLLFESLAIPSPYCYRCPLGLERPACGLACAEKLDALLAERAGQVAAVVVEPVMQGAAGMIVQPPGYLERVFEIARGHDVKFIVDEVAVGFGRTGKMFASELAGITPDFMALAKGLTAGYLPLAATLTTQEVYDGFLGSPEELRTFFHGHSYTGNALGAAAALASLDVFEEERVLETLAPKIALLAEEAERFDELPIVGDVRGVGFVANVELVADRGTRRAFPTELRVGQRVASEARRRGAILRPLRDNIYLMPPYCITEDEIRQLADIAYQSIVAVEKEIAS